MSKKSIALILCAVLAVGSIAYGSVAYMTSRDSIANVFTVGNVQVKVDETKVDKDGQPVDENNTPVDDPQYAARTETGNDYHLIPGSEYRKDPTMTVLQDSEECYVRMKVTISKFAELKAIFEELAEQYPNGFVPDQHQQGWDSAVWPFEGYTVNADNTLTLEYRYHKTVAAPNGDEVLLPLFTHISVPTAFTTDHLASIAGITIVAEGQAIQAANFATDDEAWAAFGEQYGE